MNTDGTGFDTCKECHKTEYLLNHTTTDHKEGEQLEDRRSDGTSSCNSRDRMDQRVQSLMFMMVMMMIFKDVAFLCIRWFHYFFEHNTWMTITWNQRLYAFKRLWWLFVVGTACFTSICFDLVWTALVGCLRQCVAVLKLGLCMSVIGRPGLWSSLGLVVRELGPGMLWACVSSCIQVPECCLLLQFVKVLVLRSPILTFQV